ncbi:hypothetical protein [Spirillospora sp. NBC_01491]|uniref:hypothetical protein n=1 Tax=Spirillospora sp. NBC_01491 TaxID=2976007 RepID=UPI002E33AB0B|nr:hypothetical protein [Spirillospora sp. NBC_01491]
MPASPTSTRAHPGRTCTASPRLASESEQLGEALGSIVMVIRRTYAGARPLGTADIIVPVDRFELAYALPVG